MALNAHACTMAAKARFESLRCHQLHVNYSAQRVAVDVIDVLAGPPKRRLAGLICIVQLVVVQRVVKCKHRVSDNNTFNLRLCR